MKYERKFVKIFFFHFHFIYLILRVSGRLPNLIPTCPIVQKSKAVKSKWVEIFLSEVRATLLAASHNTVNWSMHQTSNIVNENKRPF